MRNFISILFLIVPALAFSQAIVKGGGIVYTNGAPTHSININTDAEVAIDTSTGYWHERSRDGLGWILAGFRVQKHAGSSPPSASPLDKQSEVLLNDADSLYRWRSGAWRHINKVLVYTAGTGISVTGTVIANTGDLSATNEGTLGVGAGGANSSLLTSNTSGATGVTFAGGGIVAITESTSANGGSITITGTEVDGSVSNELQTFGHSGTTSYTNTLSNGGGSFTLQSGGIVAISNSSGTVTISATEVDGSVSNEGSLSVGAGTSTTSLIQSNTSGSATVTLEAGTNVTISESGNTITIAASGGGGGATDLTFSGSSSPVTLNSSTGTDVTFTAGTNVTLSATSGNITINSTEIDGSVTNEAWTIDGDDADTEVISNQTVKFQGAGITTTDYNPATDVLLITSTEVDGSTTNEVLTISDGTDSEALGGQTLTVSGAGITTADYVIATNTLTITSTEVDGSISNEGSLTVAAGSGTTSIINSNTSGQTGVTLTAAGALSISESGNVITLTATEVDGSVSNEGSLTVAAGTSTTSIINSNTFGQTGVTIEAGSNITISESGNTITIAASGGGTTDLTFTGTSSPVTLNSSTGTDVTFTAGTGITLSASSGNITINATGGGAANYQLFRDDGVDATVQPTANFVSTSDIAFTLTNDGGNTETEVSADIPANAVQYAEIQQVAASRLLGNPTGSTADVSEISLGAGITFSGTTLVATDPSTTNEAWTIDGDDADTEVISNQTVKFQGAGIAVTDYNPTTDVLLITATEVDGSTSNELQTFGHSGTTSYTNTLSNGGGSFTLQASGIVTISNSSGTVTIGATEVDGSTTNELQTISNTSDATSHTATLSNSGGSTQFVEGSGITMATTGTGLNGILTITAVDASTTNEVLTVSDGTDSEALGGQTLTFAGSGITAVDYVTATNTLTITSTEVDGSISNEGSLTVAAGSGTTSIINSNTSGQTGVTLTAAGILAISESGNTITLTATEVDGSTTNENLTISDGTDSENMGGQTLTVSASGIATVDYVPATNTLTIGATEVDGSISNEGSLTVAAGTGTTSIINSNTSGQTGVTLTAAGILAISESGNNITLTATEVDGSTSNELQTLANTSNATTHTVTLSNSGGSVQLAEGSGITLTTTGTGLDGVVTIAATGGGANYQLLRDDGSDMAVQPTANFVSTGDVVFTLTNDAGNTETEVSADIPANSIQYAEIQQVAANRLLGNPTGSTADPSEISLATGLSFAGTVLTPADASATNEGSLTVNAGSGTTSIISSNTSGSTDVTLTAGSGITISETGNNITIAASGGGGGAPTDAQYVTLSTNGTLTDERVLTAGLNVTNTDAGAGGALTVDVLGGNQTTSQFTADQDNFSPTNWSTRTTHYVSSDATIRAITSFSALADGTLRRLVNTGSHPIYIPGEHPDGTAANRVITDSDIFIPPNGGIVTIFYDGNTSRWRIESSSFDPASQGANGAYGHYYNFSVGATITGDWGTLTLVGNNDVSAPTTSLLAGYSSNTTTSATGQGSWYFSDVVLNPTEYGLTHTVGSALVQITGNLSTSAQRYTAQVGFIPTPSSTTLAVNNSIGIRYSDNINSGNWQGFTRNSGGTESTVDLGVTAATNTGYVLTICVDKGNTEARFYINGVFRGRITANLPTSGADYGFRGGIWKSVGTTLRDIVTPWAIFYTVKGF